jgi:hypothetical protein
VKGEKRFRPRLPLLVGASVGVAVAALVITSGLWPPSSRAVPLRLRPLPLRDNKQHLASGEIATLLRWARRYRACAIHNGLQLDPPITGANEIVITGPGRSRISPRESRRALLPCDSEVDTPPPHSAMALMADRWLHLYLPRTCRLPVLHPGRQ